MEWLLILGYWEWVTFLLTLQGSSVSFHTTVMFPFCTYDLCCLSLLSDKSEGWGGGRVVFHTGDKLLLGYQSICAIVVVT